MMVEYIETFIMTTLEKQRDNKRRFHAKQRELGLCLECINPVAKGKIRCEKHLAHRRKTEAEQRIQAAKIGFCHYCRKSPQLEKNRQCESCYFKSVSHRHLGSAKYWQLLKTMFESQKAKCALSGLSLTLGVNADLDHIVPRIKGGTDDIENLQWVLAHVNNFKSGMLEPDFFQFIKSIHDTMQIKYGQP